MQCLVRTLLLIERLANSIYPVKVGQPTWSILDIYVHVTEGVFTYICRKLSFSCTVTDTLHCCILKLHVMCHYV